MPIQRISLFKIPNQANIQPMLDGYKKLSETNSKDGKPYVLTVKAHASLSGDRGKGYTLVGMTRYKDLEDMKYYDEECEAHKRFKEECVYKMAEELPPLTVFFED